MTDKPEGMDRLIDDHYLCTCFGEKKFHTRKHWCENHCPDRFLSEAPMSCLECPLDDDA